MATQRWTLTRTNAHFAQYGNFNFYQANRSEHPFQRHGWYYGVHTNDVGEVLWVELSRSLTACVSLVLRRLVADATLDGSYCELPNTLDVEDNIQDADIIVYDCEGMSDDGVVYRHIQLWQMDQGCWMDTNGLTINGVYAACSLPGRPIPTNGWHHGWTCHSTNRRCRLGDRRSNQWVLSPISFHDALSLGFCFQDGYEEYAPLRVFRPDGTMFYANDYTEALEWITDGQHLMAYIEAPYCDLACPVRIVETARLITMGYDPDCHYLDGDQVRTLEGDISIGLISEYYDGTPTVADNAYHNPNFDFENCEF